MGPIQTENKGELARKEGFLVVRQLGEELRFVDFIMEEADALDRAEDEAGESNQVLYVINVTRFAKEEAEND